MTARVALPLPLDAPFSYAVPDAFEGDVVPGVRVVVPLGPRVVTGVVVVVDADDDGEGLKAITDVLDDAPAPADLLALTKWVADYYVCGWGEALRAALPSGLDVETVHRLRRTDAPPGDLLADASLGPAIRHLDAHPEITLDGLRQRVPHATLALVRRLERAGLVEIDTGTSDARVAVRTETAVRLTDAFRDPAARARLRETLRGAKQRAILDVLGEMLDAGDDEPAQAAVLARAGASTGSMKALVDAGAVERGAREVQRRPDVGDVPEPPPAVAFTEGQQAAIDVLTPAVAAGVFASFLLHGVTGSGKTEVYVEALRRTLAAGRTGLVLVPEIALTPQTVRRFRAHFGDQIAVLHSRMSLGERYDAWRAIRAGAWPSGTPVRVVIGPRSAIFAPLSNLGLVVVDEEHEASYKQVDPAPRYHARDVALVRARQAGAVCVLGSATPSLESWHNATLGKHTRLDMPERVPLAGGGMAQLPPVTVVDLVREQKRHRLAEGASLSDALVDALKARVAAGEQAVVLQNRRGYAPVVECRACGHVPFCRDCDVPMTYHRARHHLRCHYCGRTQRVPTACASCGSVDVTLVGAGTQRVEEEIVERVPGVRLARMDQDTTATKDGHHRILERFGKGEADVLLGTQMVAKGLDFPRVTLVGVVNADAGRHRPDFRADERAFQLLTQVAGRAGRAERAGEVIVQTRQPDAPAIAHAARHDVAAWAEAELLDREAAGWPPFWRVVVAEVRGRDEVMALRYARRLHGALAEALAPLGAVVHDPQPALVARVKQIYRFTLTVRIPRNAPPAQPLLRRVRDAEPPPSGTRLVIDVDAVGG